MMAPCAFIVGMRLHIRRYCAPGKVWVRPVLMDASPRVPPMQGLPRPVAFLPLRLPADSLTRGAVLAQEARCPAAGKALMSTPIPAMRSRAVVIPNPGMPSSCSTCCSYGWHMSAILLSRTSIWAVSWSMLSSIICRTKACAPALVREHLRVALARGDRAGHVPAGHPVDVADHRGQLQVPVFQQLLAALLLRGAHLDQLAPVAGVRAQPADFLRRHEAAGQRPRSVILASHAESSLPSPN